MAYCHVHMVFDEALEEAGARWAELLRADPTLAPAVTLQRRLLQRSRALLESLLPLISAQPPLDAAGGDLAALGERLARGVPIGLNGVEIPEAAWTLMVEALMGFCRDLDAGGAGDAAWQVEQALASDRLDARALLAASLARADCAIRAGCQQVGVSADVTWLVAELAVGPYAYARQLRLHAQLGDRWRGWTRGYCPVCGSWPALAEARGGGHALRCSLCAASWTTDADRCPYCDAPGGMGAAAPADPDRPDRLLVLCQACRGYLKVLRVPAPLELPGLAVEDLASADLDRLALERGFHRPPLTKFESAQ